MFSSVIESSILGVGAAFITEVAIGVMFVVFVTAGLLRVGNRAGRLTTYTPTLLTSIGIFGTFCGIVAGLLGFEVSDIDGSIDSLLAGMKTAFITSLMGMLLSILFKLFLSSWPAAKASKNTPDNLGIADLYEVMHQQNESLKQLTAAVSGDDEGSLVGQLKFIKSNASDHHREHMQLLAENQARFSGFQEQLQKQMQEFADSLSQSATEQVIEALNQVINDFNNNLTEQFGENFKELNTAVGRLVDWQENYKQQLAEMHDQYAQGVSAIGQTQLAVASISEHTGTIPNTMQALQSVINTNQTQVESLGGHLSAFKDMREAAVKAVPEIQKHVTDTLTGVQGASKKLVEGIDESATLLQKAVEQNAELLSDGSKEAAEHLKQSGRAIEENAKKLDEAISSELSHVMTDMGSALGKITGRVSDEYNKMVAANQNNSRNAG